jgi:hypothetical protein
MKPVSSRSALVAALMPFALAAAAADTRETRPVTEFTEVSLSAPIDVHVTQGAAPSLTLEGDPEALARIETVVDGHRLKIRVQRGQRWGRYGKVTARVSARQVEALSIAGSGEITAAAISGNTLAVSIAGSGDVRVGGKVDGLTANISGSGDIRAGDLDAQSVKVSIAGSGDATVRARQSLTVSVAGSGDVRYFGDPAVHKSILGSGRVRRASSS